MLVIKITSIVRLLYYL